MNWCLLIKLHKQYLCRLFLLTSHRLLLWIAAPGDFPPTDNLIRKVSRFSVLLNLEVYAPLSRNPWWAPTARLNIVASSGSIFLQYQIRCRLRMYFRRCSACPQSQEQRHCTHLTLGANEARGLTVGLLQLQQPTHAVCGEHDAGLARDSEGGEVLEHVRAPLAARARPPQPRELLELVQRAPLLAPRPRAAPAARSAQRHRLAPSVAVHAHNVAPGGWCRYSSCTPSLKNLSNEE